jgi:hypothetical protein
LRLADFQEALMSDPHPEKPPAVFPSLQEKHERALSECDRLIGHFTARADRYKHLFKGLKYSSIILAIGVTVLAALPSNPMPWTLPVVAGLAALCTTMLSATRAQELWVLSRNAQMHFQVEKFNYCQGVGSYSRLGDEDKVRRFSEQVIEIWSSGHEVWQKSISEKQLEGRRETSDEHAGPNQQILKPGRAKAASREERS